MQLWLPEYLKDVIVVATPSVIYRIRVWFGEIEESREYRLTLSRAQVAAIKEGDRSHYPGIMKKVREQCKKRGAPSPPYFDARESSNDKIRILEEINLEDDDKE